MTKEQHKAFETWRNLEMNMARLMHKDGFAAQKGWVAAIKYLEEQQTRRGLK
jgi:hypothetical protein